MKEKPFYEVAKNNPLATDLKQPTPEDEPHWNTEHYQTLRKAFELLGYNLVRSIGASIHYWYNRNELDPYSTALRVFAYEDKCAVLCEAYEGKTSMNYMDVTGTPEQIVQKIDYYFGRGNHDW